MRRSLALNVMLSVKIVERTMDRSYLDCEPIMARVDMMDVV